MMFRVVFLLVSFSLTFLVLQPAPGRAQQVKEPVVGVVRTGGAHIDGGARQGMSIGTIPAGSVYLVTQFCYYIEGNYVALNSHKFRIVFLPPSGVKKGTCVSFSPGLVIEPGNDEPGNYLFCEGDAAADCTVTGVVTTAANP